MSEPSCVYVIGTFDTKASELLYAAERIAACGAALRTVDISTGANTGKADVSNETVARCHPQGSGAVLAQKDRGVAVKAMTEALIIFLGQQKDIGAVLGLGGSGNTSMVASAMQQLRFGIPKLIVSTLASGNVGGFVGPSDIMMMHSVADIAGLNSITKTVIANAAHAMAGMALNTTSELQHSKPAVGLTMFGVTTTAVEKIRAKLENHHECFVFHATGMGGQCFEKLIDSHFLQSAIDITTTEVGDYLFGGVLPCTADRFGALIRQKIPSVISVGAVDMINFGAFETVPDKFKHRNLYRHNAAVTLMRTTPEENQAIGKWIIERVNQMQGLVQFMLPHKGVSAIDAKGQPFYDTKADAALFDAIKQNWHPAPNRQLIEVDAHINDQHFADAVLSSYSEIMV